MVPNLWHEGPISWNNFPWMRTGWFWGWFKCLTFILHFIPICGTLRIFYLDFRGLGFLLPWESNAAADPKEVMLRQWPEWLGVAVNTDETSLSCPPLTSLSRYSSNRPRTSTGLWCPGWGPLVYITEYFSLVSQKQTWVRICGQVIY